MRNDTYDYLGDTANKLKTRIYNHIHAFKKPRLKNATSISKLIWKLKDHDMLYKVHWETTAKAISYKIRDCPFGYVH